MSRGEFKKYKNNNQLDLAGVYVIYSTTSAISGIYIGEGNDVRSRLKEHESGKVFWDELIIFTSSRMNVAFAKNIEYQFIRRAELSSKYPLYNGVSGGKRKLGIEDKEHLKKHLIDFYKVIELANIDIFEINPNIIYNINNYGHDINVKILNLDIKKIRVLCGSIIGRAFSSRANMGDI
jgi:predicted GIY-YIG superfamily endonuclease